MLVTCLRAGIDVDSKLFWLMLVTCLRAGIDVDSKLFWLGTGRLLIAAATAGPQ